MPFVYQEDYAMPVNQALQRRYATKSFDPSRSLPAHTVQQLLDAMRWCPSSTNIQPWHFIVASTPAGKARIAKGAAGSYSYNEAKILNASHVVLMCSRVSVDDAHLQQVLAAEEQAGRFAGKQEAAAMAHATRVSYHDFHRFEKKDVSHWLEKQVYLNLGSLLLAAGLLDIDAVPLEGINHQVLNAEFDLNARDLTAVVAVALGYRAADDFNAGLPKARLAVDDIFTLI